MRHWDRATCRTDGGDDDGEEAQYGPVVVVARVVVIPARLVVGCRQLGRSVVDAGRHHDVNGVIVVGQERYERRGRLVGHRRPRRGRAPTGVRDRREHETASSRARFDRSYIDDSTAAQLAAEKSTFRRPPRTYFATSIVPDTTLQTLQSEISPIRPDLSTIKSDAAGYFITVDGWLFVDVIKLICTRIFAAVFFASRSRIRSTAQ